MRSSSVRVLTLSLTGLLLIPAAIVGLGCGPTEQAAPSKLERHSPFDRGQVKKPEHAPNDPIRDPATEVPRGRDGDQVSDEQIDAALAEAAKLAEIEDVAQERNVLRKCANKTPASARCDGRMGLSMITAKNRRATALYYLREAAKVDDPKADAALYMEIGEWLRKFGHHDHAVAAMQKGVARDPSAANLFAFGRLLSLDAASLREAADRIAEARTKDDRIEWLYEEAVIRGQVPVREQAQRSVKLFEEYRARAETLPAESLPAAPESLEARMAELAELAKRYPSEAEYDKTQAAKPSESDPAPEPKPVEPT